jgi:hypothetical protein
LPFGRVEADEAVIFHVGFGANDTVVLVGRNA